jgi:hypothetical protein
MPEIAHVGLGEWLVSITAVALLRSGPIIIRFPGKSFGRELAIRLAPRSVTSKREKL